MADHQKIHPVDVEAAAPTAPLVKNDSLKSTYQGSPDRKFPPHPRTIPVSHSKPPKRRSCSICRCFCWTLSLLLLLLVLIAATGGILYLVFRPKLPKYSVNSLKISNLDVSNNTLSAAFNVTITARNPNKKIGIYYKGGSHLSVWYNNVKLSEGTLPEFYQGHQNTTVLAVAMTGQTQFGSSLMNSLNDEQQQRGSIPLDLKARVPVRVKFGRLKLRKVKFLVRCKLVVNITSATNDVSIRTSSCKFKLRL